MNAYRPRQKDVAKLAGVSQAIVSHVINGKTEGDIRISTETKQRVWEAIHQLGYAPNPVARGLRTGQNHILGVFTYQPVFPLKTQSFYFPFLLGIEEEAERQNYNLLLMTRSSAEDGTRSVYRNGENQLLITDGAIVLGTDEKRDELGRLLHEGFPFLCIGRREIPEGSLSYVAADASAATAGIVKHLFSLGHQKIVYLGEQQVREPNQDREQGYHLAFTRQGFQVDPQHISRNNRKLEARQLGAWLQEGITAFVAESNRQAALLLKSLSMLGKQVPQDVSLALLGDPDKTILERDDITAFKIPGRKMGIQAVRMLVDKLSHTEVQGPLRMMLPCTFSPGRSTAPPKKEVT